MTQKFLYREAEVEADTVDLEAMTVQVSFSSEMAVKRYYGMEILDHSPSSVDMSFLASGRAPFLNDHDTREQVGVVVSASILPERKGVATLRLSRSVKGQELLQDMKDRVRTCISVGYIPLDMVLESEKDGLSSYRVTKWKPVEISSVAIPADTSVGFGRAAENTELGLQIASLIERTKPSLPAQPQGRNAMAQDNLTNEEIEKRGRDAATARMNDILAMAAQYRAYCPENMVCEALQSGKTVDQFREDLLAKVYARHTDTSNIALGMSGKEIREYSISRGVTALMTGDWSKAGLERELSQDVEKRTGYNPAGFFVPVDVAQKRAFNAGTPAEGGNLVQTTVAGGELVDILRNNLVFNKLGVRIMAGLTSNLAIPRKTSSTVIQSLGETSVLTPTRPTTGQSVLTPKRIGGQVIYSKQSVIQASQAIDAMMSDDLIQSLAVQMEYFGFNGTGASSQVLGLLNQPGIGAVVGGANGAQIEWSHIVGLETVCANANSEPDLRAGYATTTKTRGFLKGKPKTQNSFVWGDDNRLNGYRAECTNNLPNNLTKGTSVANCSATVFSADWSDMVIGLFGGLDITVDQFSRAGTAELIITANQFFDLVIRQMASFSVMADGLTQ